jgi:hypothetical protein
VWFSGISEREKQIVALAVSAFDDGDKASAEKIADALPPAPKFPLAEDS